MICPSCRNCEHGKCKGREHCDCQHRKTIRLDSGYIADASGTNEFEGREAGV